MKDAPTKLYYSISEVSQTTGIKAHVLRYWESQFSMLRPRKSRGGIRKYRPKDLSLIEEIRHLLYDRGFTIAGARRKLREDRRDQIDSGAEPPVLRLPPSPRIASTPTIVRDRDRPPEGEDEDRREPGLLVRNKNQQEFDLGGHGVPRGAWGEIRRELGRLHAMLLKPVGRVKENERIN